MVVTAGFWLALNRGGFSFSGGRSGQASEQMPEYSSTPSATPRSTRTPFQPVPPTPTNTPTNTPTPTRTPTATPKKPTPLPDSHRIHVSGQAMWFSLDCEARTAVDLAGYFGISINELDFLKAMPYSDDPEEGFVGRYNGVQGRTPPGDYGIHAPPVAALLRSFGLNAKAHKGLSFDTIRKEIANDRPVMVWVVGSVWQGSPISYTASNGNATTVAILEHTVMVIGYGPDYVTILDGSMVYNRSMSAFSGSWGVLGNMAITVKP
jgi:uncharacterized protein YvpB